MKKLIIATAFIALALPAIAKTPKWMVKSVGAKDADAAYANVREWEKESRRDPPPKTKKRYPRAEAYIKAANSLLVGDPTCKNMLAASKLLEKAEKIYEDAGEFGGDVRHLGRRAGPGGWLDSVVEGGDCRK